VIDLDALPDAVVRIDADHVVVAYEVLRRG
jgi:hypothetical protein